MTASTIRDAIAAALHAAGVGTYRPSGGYAAGDTAPIFFSRTPATPDRVITITVYPVALDHIAVVQVRARGSAGATTSAEDLADAIRATLHGREDLPGIELLTWQSGARIGFDTQQRDEFSLNFHALTDDPATATYHSE